MYPHPTAAGQRRTGVIAYLNLRESLEPTLHRWRYRARGMKDTDG
jgi:hypothetical protein